MRMANFPGDSRAGRNGQGRKAGLLGASRAKYKLLSAYFCQDKAGKAAPRHPDNQQ